MNERTPLKAKKARVFHPQTSLPEAYFESFRGHYWIQDNRDRWMPVNEVSVKRAYKAAGFTTGIPDGGRISSLDAAILRTQRERNVEYAGGLAGYRAGVMEMLGNRVLVTSSPKLIEPKAGKWNTLGAFLQGLLLDEDFDQTPFLFGWLKVAVECLRKGLQRPGQALAIAGPKDCGKSLLQQLITELLGGRVANPYQYMIKQTTFNGEMFAAEHLVVEDSAASTDIRTRREFGSALKELTVNDVRSCHPKNKQPLSLKPFWRLSITVNDEPENLMVLPPIDESLEDKLILLRARKETFPMLANTTEEKTLFWETLISELPAFVHFLLDWQIPEHLQGRRFGVVHFHHPELLRILDDLSPEKRLLTIIDAEIFAGVLPETWEGTAGELEKRLSGSDCTSHYEARRVLSFNTACGVYLARLAAKHPERIGKRVLHGNTHWSISPPKGGG